MKPISVDEFKSDKENIIALRGFLETKQGLAFLAAIAGSHPLRQLADISVKGVVNQHAAAAALGKGGTSKSALGKSIGYQNVINLIEELQLPAKPKPEKQSKKAGAPPKAAPLPPT